jgi:cytochrome c553
VKFLLLVMSATLGQIAWAQPAKASVAEFQTTLWAVSCMACHGTDGRAEGVGMSIGGRPSQELYDTLLAFKSGKKEATIMHQHTKGYSDEELKRIAQFFSQVK